MTALQMPFYLMNSEGMGTPTLKMRKQSIFCKKQSLYVPNISFSLKECQPPVKVKPVKLRLKIYKPLQSIIGFNHALCRCCYTWLPKSMAQL